MYGLFMQAARHCVQPDDQPAEAPGAEKRREHQNRAAEQAHGAQRLRADEHTTTKRLQALQPQVQAQNRHLEEGLIQTEERKRRHRQEPRVGPPQKTLGSHFELRGNPSENHLDI